MSNPRTYTVCVTGGAGFIGSCIVKKLLEKGHIVRATSRNISDENKVGVLKKLEGAEARLELFQADIYKPDEFDVVIKGCDFVFHVATPSQHSPENSHQYKNTTEATLAGAKSIGESCIRSGTVKRLIYTASALSASPLNEDGVGFKDVMDESCWTPLNHHFPYANDYLEAYVESKTLSEKAILQFGDKNEFEVVTLACGLVGGGDTSNLSFLPGSTGVIVSHPTQHGPRYQSLKFLEAVMGKVPVVHIDDVVEAHIFCMDQPCMTGRYLCANGYVTTTEIADHFRYYHPQLRLAHEWPDQGEDEKLERSIHWGSTKLNDVGFVYKCDVKRILDDSVECAKKFGDIS